MEWYGGTPHSPFAVTSSSLARRSFSQQKHFCKRRTAHTFKPRPVSRAGPAVSVFFFAGSSKLFSTEAFLQAPNGAYV